MTIRVFISSASSDGKPGGAERIRSLIVDKLKAASLDSLITIGAVNEICDFCGEAKADEKTDLVVVAGDDATLAEAVSHLTGGSLPIAVIPCGAINLVAHDVGVGGHIERAIDTIVEGRPRFIDVGFVNGRAFLNNVVFGGYAKMTDARGRMRAAEGLPERLGAIAEATDALLSAKPTDFHVRLDSQTLDVRSNLLMVTNNEYSGAAELRPRRQNLNRGTLCAYVAKSDDGIDLVARIAEVLEGTIDSSGEIKRYITTRCVIENGEDKLLAAVDGEPVWLKTPIELTLMPRAIALLAPK